MPLIKGATFGTFFSLAGTALLLVATLSTPIWKSVYFLSADVSGTISGVSESGNLTFGSLGYCISDSCVGPKLGYKINSTLLDLSGVSSSIVHWITYVLVLHPAAAAIGALSTIFGLLGHVSGMSISMTLVAAWLGGIAGTISLLAFIFDIVLFTIAKSRINSASTDDVDTNAQYGSALWLTLAGFLIFSFSGCAFSFGRRLTRERLKNKTASDAYRPQVDQDYASNSRQQALLYEKSNADDSRTEMGLPAFPENQMETVPLTTYNQHQPDDSQDWGVADTSYQSSQGYYPQMTGASSHYDRQAIDGVGMGYGRRSSNEMPTHGDTFSPEQAALIPNQQSASAYGASTAVQNRLRAGRNYPNHTEPFTGSLSQPQPGVTSTTADMNGVSDVLSDYGTPRVSAIPFAPPARDFPSAVVPGSNPTTFQNHVPASGNSLGQVQDYDLSSPDYYSRGPMSIDSRQAPTYRTHDPNQIQRLRTVQDASPDSFAYYYQNSPDQQPHQQDWGVPDAGDYGANYAEQGFYVPQHEHAAEDTHWTSGPSYAITNDNEAAASPSRQRSQAGVRVSRSQRMQPDSAYYPTYQ